MERLTGELVQPPCAKVDFGSVRDWVQRDDQTGVTSVAEHLEYDAYGNIISHTTSSGQAVTNDAFFAFTGREWDADADLYFYRARWYDPGVGRFISEDPLGFGAGDVNVQRYVGNHPNLATDPSGLAEKNATAYKDPLKLTVAHTFVPEADPQLTAVIDRLRNLEPLMLEFLETKHFTLRSREQYWDERWFGNRVEKTRSADHQHYGLIIPNGFSDFEVFQRVTSFARKNLGYADWLKQTHKIQQNCQIQAAPGSREYREMKAREEDLCRQYMEGAGATPAEIRSRDMAYWMYRLFGKRPI